MSQMSLEQRLESAKARAFGAQTGNGLGGTEKADFGLESAVNGPVGAQGLEQRLQAAKSRAFGTGTYTTGSATVPHDEGEAYVGGADYRDNATINGVSPVATDSYASDNATPSFGDGPMQASPARQGGQWVVPPGMPWQTPNVAVPQRVQPQVTGLASNIGAGLAQGVNDQTRSLGGAMQLTSRGIPDWLGGQAINRAGQQTVDMANEDAAQFAQPEGFVGQVARATPGLVPFIAGTAAGGLPGGMAVGAIQGGGGAFADVKARQQGLGATDEQAGDVAAPAGIGGAALGAVMALPFFQTLKGASPYVSQLLDKAAPAAVQKMLANPVGARIVSAAESGSANAVQHVASRILEDASQADPVTMRRAFEGAGAAFTMGAALQPVGEAMHLAGRLAGGRENVPSPRQPQEESQAPRGTPVSPRPDVQAGSGLAPGGDRGVPDSVVAGPVSDQPQAVTPTDSDVLAMLDAAEGVNNAHPGPNTRPATIDPASLVDSTGETRSSMRLLSDLAVSTGRSPERAFTGEDPVSVLDEPQAKKGDTNGQEERRQEGLLNATPGAADAAPVVSEPTDLAGWREEARRLGVSDKGTLGKVRARVRRATQATTQALSESATTAAPLPKGEPMTASTAPESRQVLDQTRPSTTVAAPPAGREAWEMTAAELLANEDPGVRANSMTPDTRPLPPLGTLAMDKYGKYVMRLEMVDPRSLDLTEDAMDGRNWPGFDKYVQWAKEGKRSPVYVSRNHATKKLTSSNRRRVLAAIDAGVKEIPAWVDVLGPDGIGMKHEAIVEQAVRDGKPVPAAVLADYPALAAKVSGQPTPSRGPSSSTATDSASQASVESPSTPRTRRTRAARGTETPDTPRPASPGVERGSTSVTSPTFATNTARQSAAKSGRSIQPLTTDTGPPSSSVPRKSSEPSTRRTRGTVSESVQQQTPEEARQVQQPSVGTRASASPKPSNPRRRGDLLYRVVAQPQYSSGQSKGTPHIVEVFEVGDDGKARSVLNGDVMRGKAFSLNEDGSPTVHPMSLVELKRQADALRLYGYTDAAGKLDAIKDSLGMRAGESKEVQKFLKSDVRRRGAADSTKYMVLTVDENQRGVITNFGDDRAAAVEFNKSQKTPYRGVVENGTAIDALQQLEKWAAIDRVAKDGPDGPEMTWGEWTATKRGADKATEANRKPSKEDREFDRAWKKSDVRRRGAAINPVEEAFAQPAIHVEGVTREAVQDLNRNIIDKQAAKVVKAITGTITHTAGPILRRARQNLEATLVAKLTDTKKSEALQHVQAADAARLSNEKVAAEAVARIREAKGGIALGQHEAQDQLRAFQGKPGKLTSDTLPPEARTPETSRAVFDFLNGKKSIGDLPAPARPMAEKAKATIEGLRQQMLSEGLMSQETFDRYKDRYVPHVYAKREAESRVGKAIRTRLTERLGKPRLSDKYVILDGKGKPVTPPQHGSPGFDDALSRDLYLDSIATDAVLKRLNVERKAAGRDLLTPADLNNPKAEKFTKAAGRLLAAERAKYETRNPASEADYEAMGRITDPGYVVASAVLDATHNLATARMFKDLSKMQGVVGDLPESGEAPPGYIKLPDDPRFGPLAGKSVLKDVAAGINEMVESRKLLTRVMDESMRLWKKGKTVYSPATHMRNVISNAVVFAPLAGVNPANPRNLPFYAKALKAMAGHDRVGYAEAVKAGMFGGTEVSEELRNQARSMLDGGQVTTTNLLGKMLRRGDSAAEGLYQSEDTVFRLAAFYKARARGGTVQQAAEQVRTWFPFYDQLPTRIAGIPTANVRRVIPFLSFTYESSRIAGSALKYKPFTLAAILSAAPALDAAFSSMLGLSDDEKKSVRKGMRGTVGGKPVFSTLLPWRDSQGRLTQLDLSNVIPWANPLGFRVDTGQNDARGVLNNVAQQALSSNPLSGFLQTVATNRDGFFDRPVVGDEYTGTERAQAWGHQMIRQFLPTLAGDAANDLLPNPAGRQASVFTPSRIPTGQREKRDPAQYVARRVGGIDIRSADPSVGRLIADFQSENKYPERAKIDDGTAVGRARRELYNAVVNSSQKDFAAAQAKLARLGSPARTPKQVRDVIGGKDPLTGLRKADRGKFLRGLNGVERASVERARKEHGDAMTRAVQMWRAGR